MKNDDNNNNGIGFLGALTLIFVIAKITGHISWSWPWVFSPIIIGIALVMVLAMIVAILESKK